MGVLATRDSYPRVLLRNAESQRYYSASGEWCLPRDEAFDFGGAPEAIRFACLTGLNAVELVFAYDNPELDATFGLHPPRTARQPVSWLDCFRPPTLTGLA